MTLRRWCLALAALLLVGCASTQPGVNALAPTTGPEGAVARITYRDGSVEYISQETLDQFQNQIFATQQGPAPAEPVLNELITRRLLLREARNNDVVAEPQRIEQFVSRVQTQDCPQILGQQPPQEGPRGSDAFLDQCAQQIGFGSGDDLRNFLAEQLTIDEIARRQAPKDLIQASHILFAEADSALAQETYTRLCGGTGPATTPREQGCQENANFDELARQLSIEPGADQSGGELPPFNEQGLTEPDPLSGQPNAFDTTFVSNTVALKPAFEAGEPAISRPFLTQFGWHIVKLTDLVASTQSAQNYRDAVLTRARDAQVADLQQPDSGETPLIGVAEILVELPAPPALPTVEPIVPEPEPTPLEDVTAGPIETAEPEATPEPEATAEPETTAEPEATTTP